MKILESRSSFSSSFDRIGSRLIDLYNFISSADLPGFWIIIICTTFHWDRKNSHLPIKDCIIYLDDIFPFLASAVFD